MFSYHDFLMKGLLDAVNKQSNYWVMLNAAAYYEKGILTDADLEEIETLIESTQTVEEQAIEELQTELDDADAALEEVGVYG